MRRAKPQFCEMRCLYLCLGICICLGICLGICISFFCFTLLFTKTICFFCFFLRFIGRVCFLFSVLSILCFPRATALLSRFASLFALLGVPLRVSVDLTFYERERHERGSFELLLFSRGTVVQQCHEELAPFFIGQYLQVVSVVVVKQKALFIFLRHVPASFLSCVSCPGG